MIQKWCIVQPYNEHYNSNTNQFDMGRVNLFDFDDYTISVIPYDFDRFRVVNIDQIENVIMEEFEDDIERAEISDTDKVKRTWSSERKLESNVLRNKNKRNGIDNSTVSGRASGSNKTGHSGKNNGIDVDNEPHFSMRNISEADYGTLLEERDYLKEQVELLQKEFEITKGHSPKMEDIQRMGKKILKKYNSTYPIEDFNHNMKEILEFTKNSKVQNYSAVMNAMMKMGRKIAETSQEVDSSMLELCSKNGVLFNCMQEKIKEA